MKRTAVASNPINAYQYIYKSFLPYGAKTSCALVRHSASSLTMVVRFLIFESSDMNGQFVKCLLKKQVSKGLKNQIHRLFRIIKET